MDRLLIIDGHAYAYRAFYAIRELRSSAGKPTNAIYGFVKMVEKMRATVAPTHLMVVWDGGLSVERMAVLPEYKAHRPEMPDDLRQQLDEIVAYLDAAGVASYRSPGIEADDYIACLACQAADAGMNVVIASSDKDFMQLVSAQVGLLNPNDKTEAVWTDEQVRAKTGIEPSQVVDWLSLMGDSVDNIRGVPGVGTKTAADLLKQFGSIEELYRRLDDVKSDKLRGALRESEGIVRRNRELVRLHQVACEFLAGHLRPKQANEARLRELFARWGFKRMLAELSPEKQAVLI